MALVRAGRRLFGRVRGGGGSWPTVIPPHRSAGTWDYWMSPTTG